MIRYGMKRCKFCAFWHENKNDGWACTVDAPVNVPLTCFVSGGVLPEVVVDEAHE